MNSSSDMFMHKVLSFQGTCIHIFFLSDMRLSSKFLLMEKKNGFQKFGESITELHKDEWLHPTFVDKACNEMFDLVIY